MNFDLYDIRFIMASSNEYSAVSSDEIEGYWHDEDVTTVQEIEWKDPDLEISDEFKEYLDFWKTRWHNHPLNRTNNHEWHSVEINYMGEKSFDWERYVTMHDLVYKFAQRRKMVWAKRPRQLQYVNFLNKQGHEVCIVKPYSTYYEGAYANAKGTELMTEDFVLFNYDPRTHYKFSVGNYEAALKITRPIWQKRLRQKKKGYNWKYVITPTCFEFLAELQKELNGYTEEFMRNYHAISSTRPTTSVGAHPEVVKEELMESAQMKVNYINEKVETLVHDDTIPVQFQVDICKTPADVIMSGFYLQGEPHELEVEDRPEKFACDFPIPKEECLAEIDRDGKGMYLYDNMLETLPEEDSDEEECVRQLEVKDEVDAVPISSSSDEEQVAVPTEYRKRKRPSKGKSAKSYLRNNPFRWYPLIEPTKESEMYKNLPEKVKFQQQWGEGEYFRGISEVMYNIGRPDLVTLMRADSRIIWLRNKFLKASSYKLSSPEVQINARKDRQYYAQGKEDCSEIVKEKVAQLEKCEKELKHRTKILRLITQVRTQLLRHRDKMEVLSHRGRFSYLTTWDLELFRRQKSKIKSIDTAPFMEFMKTWDQYKVKCSLPVTYVEEVAKVIKLMDDSLIKQDMTDIWVTCNYVCLMVFRWKVAEFDPKLTECFVYVPQGLETPPVASTSKTGGKDITVAKTSIEPPISEGEKQVTVTMVDQREADEEKTPELAPIKDPQASLQEEVYKLLDIVKRPMMIDRITWSTGDARYKVLKSWMLPEVYFTANAQKPVVCQNLTASYVLAMFGAARFNMKIKLQINSVKFQQGLLIAYFIPYGDTAYFEGEIADNILQYPHVKIDASVSNPAEIEIPWTNFRDAFPLYNDSHQEYNYFGTFNIVVWNPLATGQNSSNDTTMVVWMWLENTEVFQLCNPKDPGKIVFASNLRGSEYDHHRAGVDGRTLQGSIKTSASTRTWVAQGLETQLIEGVGNTVLHEGPKILEKLLNSIARGSDSKPGTPLPPLLVAPQVMGCSAWGEGPDLANRLSLSPLEITKPPSDAPGPSNIKDLIKQWSRIRLATWSTEHAENTQLALIPVTPIMSAVSANQQRYENLYFFNTIPNPQGKCAMGPNKMRGQETIRYNSMLEYLARAFYYWHGSIKFRFEVVCTTMHSGRILIRYEPFGTPDSAKDECAKLATPGVVWDVQEQHILDFEAPFMSLQPFLLTQYIPTDVRLADLYTSIAGLIEIVVVNRLKVTTGISSTVEINIYMAAGDDFEFAVPSPLNGIAKLREYDAYHEPSPTSDAKIGGQAIMDYLYAYLQYPYTIEGKDWYTVITAPDGTKWRVLKASNARSDYGPLMARDSEGNFTTKQFLTTILASLKYSRSTQDAVQNFNFPVFTSIHDATSWLLKLCGQILPTDYRKFYKSMGYTIGKQDVARLYWWMAYALLRQHAMHVCEHPRDGPSENRHYVVTKEVSSVKYYAQGKSAPPNGQYINPFKGFAPKTKSAKLVMGEDFMDIYKICKRWEMWSTIELPESYNSDAQLDQQAAKDKRFINDLKQFNSWERQQFFMEYRLPVTPHQYFHSLGAKGHCFVSEQHKGSEHGMGSGDLEFQSGEGEIGSVFNITYLRYFSELFTFWKGSMRYRFTLPQPYTGTIPNVAYVCYHPRTFSQWVDLIGPPRLVHSRRLRDLSKMGMQMLSGNVMGSLDIEVPFYSQYEKLALSETIDETSSCGSVIILVPLTNIVTKPQCAVDLPFEVKGFPLNIWTAVGDDFEFIFPRAAPLVKLYPEYVYDKVSNAPFDRGYDKARWHNTVGETENQHEIAPLGTVFKEMADADSFGLQASHPFPAILNTHSVEFFDEGYDAEARELVAEIDAFSFSTYDTPKYYAQGGESNGKDECGTNMVPKTSDSNENDDFQSVKSDSDIENALSNAVQSMSENEVDGFVEDIITGVKTLPSALQDFRKITTSVGQALITMQDVLGEVRTAVVRTMDAQTETAEEVKQTASLWGKTAKWTLTGTRVVIFYQGIMNLMEAKEWNERWLPIAQCALALGLSPDLVMKAGEWLVSSISMIFGSKKGNEDRRPEGFEEVWDKSWTAFIEDHADMLKFVAAGVFTIVTFYLTSNCPVTDKVSSFATSMLRKLKNFALIGSALKTLDWMWKWMADVIKSALTWIGDACTGGSITAYKMSSHYPEVVAWLKRVEYYKQDEANQELCWNADARIDLWRCMDDGEKLLAKLSTRFGNLHSILTRGMMTLQIAHDKAVMSRNVAPFREDPFHICLCGPPGVGKSAVLTFIMNFVADECHLPRSHRFYPRGEEDDYWTKYTGQPIVLIDDLYSDKKAKAIKELVKMKSNMAWPLNMADCNEKGRCFISKMIGSTTNAEYPQHPDIVTHGAVWRRRDLLLRVSLSSVREAGRKSRWHDLRFELLDSVTPAAQPIVSGMKLEDVLVLCAEQYAKHSVKQKALVLAGLQGKEVDIADYGEAVIVGEGDMRTINDIFIEQLDKGRMLSEDLIRPWLAQVSTNDFVAIWSQDKYRKLLESSDAVGTWRVSKAKELLSRRMFNIVSTGNQNMARNVYKEAQHMCVYKEKPQDNSVVIHCVPIDENNEEKPEWGVLVKVPNDGDDEVTFAIHVANGGDDLDWYDDGEEIVSSAIELKRKAKQRMQEHDEIHHACEELVKVALKPKPTKKFHISNDEEIKKYVDTTFSHKDTSERAAITLEIKKIYERAKNSQEMRRAAQSADENAYAQLFDKKWDNHWKKDTAGNWTMHFAEGPEITDEEMSAYTTYLNMTDVWKPEEINRMKNSLPTAEIPLSGWVKTVQAYMKNKYDGAMKWFEEHPGFMATVKALAVAAGVFASYKVIRWLCPAIMDRMTNIMWGIFGWTTAKIGPERIDYVYSKGKGIRDAVVGKVSDYYDIVRSWLACSKDPQLEKMATDEACVRVYAEALSSTLQNRRNDLALRGVAEAARRNAPNPYVVGDGNNVIKPTVVVPQVVSTNQTLAQRSVPTYQAFGSNDANATNLMRHRIMTNMVYLSRVKDDGNTLSMKGLFIGGQDLLVPSHFFIGAQEGSAFSMTVMSGATEFDCYQAARCIKIPDQDLAIIRCGIRVGQYKNIITHFFKDEDLNKYSRVNAILNIMTPHRVNVAQPVVATLGTEVAYDDGKGGILSNAVVWCYESNTVPGDCGAVLVADNTAIQRKIMGLHVFGTTSSNHGGASVITQEQLASAIAELPPVHHVKATDYLPSAILTHPIEAMKVKPEGNFTLLGAVAHGQSVRLPHKSEIEKSAIFEMVREHVTEPAVLTANDPRNESGESPLVKALNKYGGPTLPFDPIDLDYVMRDLQAEVNTWPAPMGKRKLTDYEAVFGNETIDYCDRMNLAASPGYPYTLTRPSGEKGKAYLYDASAEDGIKDEKYRKEYKKREELAKQGERKISIWTDCLKDERRPLAKIKSGKTRAFMLPPADYVQLSRKYLMAFCVSFYSHHIKSFSAVGLDPYSYDWTRLVRKLRKKSMYGFGGDFHSFDGIFDPDIMWRIGKIIDNWYQRNHDEDWEESDTLVREVLFHELIHTVHICLNSVYMKHQGNPSGNPLTVVVNTFAHCFYLRLAWLNISRENQLEASLYRLHQNVAEIYYGDDGLNAVPRHCAEWYNLKTVSDFLATHGIEYTSESKDEELYGVRKITDCTFLKNGMRKMDEMNLWLAPISEDTIYELTNWVRKSDDPIAQLRENLENALSFAFHHGKVFYDSLLTRINDSLVKRGIKEMSITYEIQKQNFITRCTC